jgi:hypothetical protein
MFVRPPRIYITDLPARGQFSVPLSHGKKPVVGTLNGPASVA